MQRIGNPIILSVRLRSRALASLPAAAAAAADKSFKQFTGSLVVPLARYPGAWQEAVEPLAVDQREICWMRSEPPDGRHPSSAGCHH